MTATEEAAEAMAAMLAGEKPAKSFFDMGHGPIYRAKKPPANPTIEHAVKHLLGSMKWQKTESMNPSQYCEAIAMMEAEWPLDLVQEAVVRIGSWGWFRHAGLATKPPWEITEADVDALKEAAPWNLPGLKKHDPTQRIATARKQQKPEERDTTMTTATKTRPAKAEPKTEDGGWARHVGSQKWHFYTSPNLGTTSACGGYTVREGNWKDGPAPAMIQIAAPEGKECQACLKANTIKLTPHEQREQQTANRKITMERQAADKFARGHGRKGGEKAKPAEAAAEAPYTGPRGPGRPKPTAEGFRAPNLQVGTEIEVIAGEEVGMIGTVHSHGTVAGDGLYCGPIIVKDERGKIYEIEQQNLKVVRGLGRIIQERMEANQPDLEVADEGPSDEADANAAICSSYADGANNVAVGITPPPIVTGAEADEQQIEVQPEAEAEPDLEPEQQTSPEPPAEEEHCASSSSHKIVDMGRVHAAQPLDPINDSPPIDTEIWANLRTIDDIGRRAREQRKKGEHLVIAVRMPEGRMDAVKEASDRYHMSNAAYINAAIETLLSLDQEVEAACLASYQQHAGTNSESAEIKRATNRLTGATILVEDTWHRDSLMDSGNGRWGLRCETHNGKKAFSVKSEALGSVASPWNWCADCKRVLSGLGMREIPNPTPL